MKVKVKLLSRVRLFVTPWTVAYQAPPSMGFSRKEYWSGLSFPSPGDLPDRGIEPGCPAFQADALTSEPPGKPIYMYIYICVQFSSVQFSLSVMSDSLRPHESQHARPPCPSHLPEFTQTHCHRVSDAIQPSHPLSSPFPPAPNPSHHHSLFQ